MAESAEFQCEPCKHENVAKSASKWCTECEESLCEGCCRSHKAHKISRNHHIITFGEYQKSKTIHVNLNCPDHNKQLDFYCPIHDTVVCVECVQLKHSACKDPKPINEAAKGAKTSTAFTDLEQTIDGLLENIEKGVQNLQQSKVKMLDQEEETKNSITKKRAEIDKHLDRLQEKILKTLKSESEREATKITLMMTKLEEKCKTISDLKETAENMKKYSSNLQAFVGIRSIAINLVNEITGIKQLVSSILRLCITVQFDPKFDTFTEAFDSLGEIQITFKETVVPYVEQRIIQAQRPTEPPVPKLDNLQLKLRKNIKMGKMNCDVTGCVILPNKSIMIASRNKPFLSILKEDGSHDRDIIVPYDPFDVTIIDDQRVAVSYGLKEPSITCLTIVNVNDQSLNQSLEILCKRGLHGITYNDGKLYAVAHREGIKVIDLDGNIIKTLRIYNGARDTYKVSTQKDKIYYSVNYGRVHCVDMEGTEIWACQDVRIQGYRFLYTPAITVDNYGITFAAGYDNNLLLAISADEKQQKVLLTKSDGLRDPDAVYYDKEGKRLLVCNMHNGHAALYDVIY